MSIDDLLVVSSAVISSLLLIVSGIRLARRGSVAEKMEVVSSKHGSMVSSAITRTMVSGGADTGSTGAGISVSLGVSKTIEEIHAELSYSDLKSLLSKRFDGLVSRYGCLQSHMPRETILNYPIVPRDFEGTWSCCLLGCGGWGCAFLCSRDGESVVFKVPRGFEGVFDHGFAPTVPERLMRRIRERAEVIRALRHPNILRLLGVSRAAPVLVYEFADGGSVEWQLNKGWKPSLKDVLLLGIQVGDALRYIHSRGLVHGDVKPGNVFFVDGIAKIGDFSTLVKLITKTSSHSRFGYTPGFRAPEQAYSDLRLKAVELGLESRMDVYMLGNLLLYILTGDYVDGEEAIKPGVVDEAVKEIEHTMLRNLVKKMLEPEPWKRPSSDEAVKELLKLYNIVS